MPDPHPAEPAAASVRADVLDAASGLAAAVLLVLAQTAGTSAPRVLLTLVFAFFVPGRAIVSNWPRLAAWSGAGMSVALSLAVLALLALVTLWARVWNPLGLFDAEAVLSLVGLGVAIIRRRTRS